MKGLTTLEVVEDCKLMAIMDSGLIATNNNKMKNEKKRAEIID